MKIQGNAKANFIGSQKDRGLVYGNTVFSSWLGILGCGGLTVVICIFLTVWGGVGCWHL